MGIILYLLSVLLSAILFPLGFMCGLVNCFHQHRFRTGLKNADEKFLTLATSVDKYGNVICAELFNWALIRKGAPVRFGRIEQTISAVLGHNEKAGTLTKAGKALCWLLNLLDPNHTADAADQDNFYSCT